MSPLFMETRCQNQSPASLFTGESNSCSADPDREGRETGHRGTKRRMMNRDAARKSRQRQTERADELHEELQCLEQSNTALQKDIAALKKDLRLYTKALEDHAPLCCLRASGSSCTSSSQIERPQTTSPGGATGPSASSSLTSSPACMETLHLAHPEAPGLSAELFLSQTTDFSRSPLSLRNAERPSPVISSPAPSPFFSTPLSELLTDVLSGDPSNVSPYSSQLLPDSSHPSLCLPFQVDHSLPPAPSMSLLAEPCPPYVPLTISDSSRELSELLKDNDWILGEADRR